MNSFEQGTTHVVFIIQLPPHTSGSSFVGFQGEPWVSAHVDELHSTESDMLTLSDAMNYKISELFVGASHRGSTMLMGVSSESFERSQSEEMECSAQPVHITPQYKRLYLCIQAAAAKLRDVSNNKERAIKRIAILHDLIPKYQQISCGMFCVMLLCVEFCRISYGMLYCEMVIKSMMRNCEHVCTFICKSRLGFVAGQYSINTHFRSTCCSLCW